MKKINLKKINSAQLKWIAVIAMLIDHIGAGIILNQLYFYNRTSTQLLETMSVDEFVNQFHRVRMVYYVFRCVGRIAFPIFCYMIATGFQYTKNKWKYLIRLFIFSILSEIPFDLAFSHRLFDFEDQNVYFTLTLGLLGIILIQMIFERVRSLYLRYPLTLLVIIGCILAAELLRTDYSGPGVLIIILMYLYFKMPVYRDISVSFVLLYMILCKKSHWIEVFALAGVFLLHFCNGQKGRNLPKLFFYLFYPLHLFGIAGICYLLYGF